MKRSGTTGPPHTTSRPPRSARKIDLRLSAAPRGPEEISGLYLPAFRYAPHRANLFRASGSMTPLFQFQRANRRFIRNQTVVKRSETTGLSYATSRPRRAGRNFGTLSPGVPLRSTPRYFLPSLQLYAALFLFQRVNRRFIRNQPVVKRSATTGRPPHHDSAPEGPKNDRAPGSQVRNKKKPRNLKKRFVAFLTGRPRKAARS